MECDDTGPHRPDQPAGFTELAALFAARQRSDNTRAAYSADLDRFARWCRGQGAEPLSVGPVDVGRYRARCEAEGTSPATVARRLAALSSFYALAVAEGSIGDSPLDGVARPTPPSRRTTIRATAELDAGQAAALVSAGARLSPKTAVLVDLLLLDGLKLGEALAADAGDVVDHTAGAGTRLTIGRRRGPADITLQEPTVDAVHHYLQGRRHGPLLLSDSPTGRAVGRDPGRLTRYGADYLLKRASEEAGFDQPVSANILRRSYVAMAHAAGDSVEVIRDHLGHQDSRTTRRHLDGQR